MERIALSDMENFNFYSLEDVPAVVYHLTTKESAENIIKDGRIKTFEDFICWVCEDIEHLLEYIEIYKRDKQGETHDINGQVVRYDEWNIDEMVVLKLEHTTKPFKWFRERTNYERYDGRDGKTGKPFDYDVQQKIKKMLKAAEECRIAHYGNLKFNKETAEIIPLKPYYEKYEEKWNIQM